MAANWEEFYEDDSVDPGPEPGEDCACGAWAGLRPMFCVLCGAAMCRACARFGECLDCQKKEDARGA